MSQVPAAHVSAAGLLRAPNPPALLMTLSAYTGASWRSERSARPKRSLSKARSITRSSSGVASRHTLVKLVREHHVVCRAMRPHGGEIEARRIARGCPVLRDRLDCGPDHQKPRDSCNRGAPVHQRTMTPPSTPRTRLSPRGVLLSACGPVRARRREPRRQAPPRRERRPPLPNWTRSPG